MAAATRYYTAREFASRTGYSLGDWGLTGDEILYVGPNDRVYAINTSTGTGRFFGHATEAEREFLDRHPTALDEINEKRRRIGLAPLDPMKAQWTARDLELELERVRQQNPSSSMAPWFSSGAALAGRVAGGWGATVVAQRVFGINEPLGILSPPILASRIAGQVLGAAGLAALSAPSHRGRVALGAAAGAWVPFLGGPLAALGAYYAHASTRQPNLGPSARRWLWIGGAGVLALVIGGVVYAKTKGPTKETAMTPDDAIERAIEILGASATPTEVTDAAYSMAYPDCPEKLDPSEPTHAQCIDLWKGLHALAKQALPGQRPRPVPDDLPDEGPAADMRRWLDSLSAHQRSELRRIIGPKYYDPIKRSAAAGDDGKTVGNVLRFKRAVEKFAEEDKMAALSQYLELKKLLGPKLDELLETAQKYEKG
jgi:hypothetical protein